MVFLMLTGFHIVHPFLRAFWLFFWGGGRSVISHVSNTTGTWWSFSWLQSFLVAEKIWTNTHALIFTGFFEEARNGLLTALLCLKTAKGRQRWRLDVEETKKFSSGFVWWPSCLQNFTCAFRDIVFLFLHPQVGWKTSGQHKCCKLFPWKKKHKQQTKCFSVPSPVHKIYVYDCLWHLVKPVTRKTDIDNRRTYNGSKFSLMAERYSVDFIDKSCEA